MHPRSHPVSQAPNADCFGVWRALARQVQPEARMRLTSAMFLVLLSACGEPNAETPKVAAPANAAPGLVEVPEDQVLAMVGDVPVTIAEFSTAAARRVPLDGKELSAEERAEVLDELISEKMMFLEAKRLGLDRDPKVQKAMVSTLLRRTVYSQVRNSDFSEDELRAYFEAHPDEFMVPEKRQIKRIFVRGDGERSMDEAKARASEARKKILADPAQFKDLAAEYSEDPYRRRGGDIGFVAREGKPGVPSAIVEKAYTLQQGSVSEVFEADGGANVIYVASVREPIMRTFEQMKGSVLRKVRNDKLRELLDGYVDQVEDNYTVQRHEDRLADVTLEPLTGAGPDLRLPGAPAGPEVDLGLGGHGGH
ncbi:MAG: hypothetical protein EP330_02865 [Deltaproteobacteria bacterium]|nr:MAG: hypothetical protein EP330_02865 [Deltaproteobacteria bacterium]